jgi:peptidyl-prolyl cis-trans isomerase B (cyclophilin B)
VGSASLAAVPQPRVPGRRFLLVLALSTTVLAGCGDDESSGSSAGSDSGSCTYVAEGSAAREVDPPPSDPEPADSLTITTNRGDLGVTLRTKETPCTAGSFTWLAEQGFYDGTPCHRLVTSGIFVLQCGDPSGSGSGGPGYRFDDELSGDETYPAGTLAMANAGPDTNGSQFFIVYADSPLPPAYTVFGQVDDAGLKLVEKVAKAGSEPPGDGAPKQKVVIESVG